MKKLLLKQLIQEEITKESSLEDYQVYVDLDGVLCDFMGGIVALINEERARVPANMPYFESLKPDRHNKDYILFKHAKKIADEIGWDGETTEQHLAKSNDGGLNRATRDLSYALITDNSGFWAGLEWAPGGRELWHFIEPYRPFILSSPLADDPSSEEGKRIWCKSNLGLSGGRVILAVNKGISTGDKSGILIDDKPKKLEQFGQTGILHKTGNAGASIAKLKDLGFT